MEVSINEKSLQKKFEPFELTLKVETIEELNVLYKMSTRSKPPLTDCLNTGGYCRMEGDVSMSSVTTTLSPLYRVLSDVIDGNDYK